MSINEQKILVVDDDPIVLKSLKDLLAIRGFNPNIAIGGKEAICQLDQNDYDLVLLDLHMPYVSGHDVMEHINKNKIDTSVIIVSGETSFEAAKNACTQGAYDFLRKPYATDELIITINNALKEKRLQKQNVFMQKQLAESERLHRGGGGRFGIRCGRCAHAPLPGCGQRRLLLDILHSKRCDVL